MAKTDNDFSIDLNGKISKCYSNLEPFSNITNITLPKKFNVRCRNSNCKLFKYCYGGCEYEHFIKEKFICNYEKILIINKIYFVIELYYSNIIGFDSLDDFINICNKVELVKLKE